MSSAAVPLLDDDTLAFGDEDLDNNYKKGSLTHPYVTCFHFAFRGSALITYLICGFFSDSFIANFVTIVLLLSMDFWTVKNITGRLMVGLRWWNYVDDDGQSHWIFESRKGQFQNKINDREATLFWLALILAPVVWGLLFLVCLFSFNLKWMLLVMIALILNMSNLYGYIKCKFGSKTSLSSATSNFIKTQVFQNAVSIVSRQAANPSSNNLGQPSNTV